MISTILGLFSNPFFDLLGNPKFWLGAAIVGVLVFLIFICIKYPTGGIPVLIGVASLGLVALDTYCVLQINYYYNAKGGIYGALTGIFETNKVEVVDNLTFEIKNIELTESTEGVYSANITTDQVLSLNTKESLGIFINGMPCDTTSEVHSDFAYVEYPYTFYDNDKKAICTDTLILNIAFYENSTYLNLSTKGGTLPVEECVKYWHHYFNKNGFILTVAPFSDVSTDLNYTTGNVSNCSVVKYYLDGELYLIKAYLNGSTLELPLIDNSYSNWYIGDQIVDDSFIVNEDLLIETYTAEVIETYKVKFVNGDQSTSDLVIVGSSLSVPYEPVKEGWNFAGWSTDETSFGIIDVNNYVVESDVVLTAIFVKSVFSDREVLTFNMRDKIILSMTFDDDCSIKDLINCGYEYSINLECKRTLDDVVQYLNFEVREQSGNLLFEDTSVALPYYLTSTNKLHLNTNDGKNAHASLPKGEYRIEIKDILVFTK